MLDLVWTVFSNVSVKYIAMKGWTPVAKYEHNSQLHGRQTSVFILGLCSYSVSIYLYRNWPTNSPKKRKNKVGNSAQPC